MISLLKMCRPVLSCDLSLKKKSLTLLSAQFKGEELTMKPELYNNFNVMQYRDAEGIIRKFNDIYVRSPTENLTLLDIGSGCGKVLTEVIIRQSNLQLKKVFGVDINQEMVEFAKKKYESEVIKFHCVDTVGGANALEKAMSEMGVGFGFADIVTSFNCLHWVVDLR